MAIKLFQNKKGESTSQILKVLIVDDEKMAQSVLVKIVEQFGHEAEVADTCKEALSKIDDKEFDLIFLDQYLPDGKGFEIIPEIKKKAGEVNIVAMTGESSLELESKVREKRVMYFLIKPFDINELKSLLDHLAKRKGQLRT